MSSLTSQRLPPSPGESLAPETPGESLAPETPSSPGESLAPETPGESLALETPSSPGESLAPSSPGERLAPETPSSPGERLAPETSGFKGLLNTSSRCCCVEVAAGSLVRTRLRGSNRSRSANKHRAWLTQKRCAASHNLYFNRASIIICFTCCKKNCPQVPLLRALLDSAVGLPLSCPPLEKDHVMTQIT